MIRIIGCGNLLMQDEGVGVHFIEYLKGKDLSGDVELIDGACGGFDLIPFIRESSRVIIVDTVKADGEPGTIYKFGPEDYEVERYPQSSLHDVSLKDIFDIIKLQGPLPRITIFGIEPKSIGWGMELTDDVKKVLPRLSELVIQEIEYA
jgi:hydrogenase maturation protease